MENKKKEAAKILQKYKKAKNKRQKKEELWKVLDAYDRNEQWDLQSAPPWLPKPVTNYVHIVKYTKRAALAVDNPTGKLRPVSPEGIERVEQLNKGFDYVWERIKARKVVRENVETAKLLGTAIAHVHWNEHKEGRMGSTVLGDKGHMFEGEICIEEIDPASFFPDPSAFWIDDCQFIHIVVRKPLSWIKNQPKFKGVDISSLEKGNAEDRGEIYQRDYDTKADGIVDFHRHYEKVPNAEGGYTYKITYLAGDILLASHDLKPNRYPFALLYDFKQRQDFWGMSTCEFILDNQKIINKVESIIAMIGTLLQNPQKIVSEQSGINPKDVIMYGSAPGHAFVGRGDVRAAIHYIDPPQIPTALFSLLESAKANIHEITGMSQAYLGQSVGSLQTSSGVQSLIERATMRDRDQMYDVELYIEEITSLIIDYMVSYYDEERVIRVMGENPDEYTFENFLGTDYSDLEYDIFVDVSAKAPITRLKESQEAKDMIAMQGQYGAMFPTPLITPQEYIRKSDISNKDEIIKRMNMDELQNKAEKAMQVATMMHEAMQQGLPPEEVLAMGQAMFEQLDKGGGMGSTANANEFQASQGAPI